MAQIVLAKLDILIILDLRCNFTNHFLYELHFHDVFGDVGGDAQRPEKGIEKPE